MQQQNTITHNDIVLRISNKQRPFGNNFVCKADTVREVLYEGQRELHALVTCTSNSKEPGRIYSVMYNVLTGTLESCCTVN